MRQKSRHNLEGSVAVMVRRLQLRESDGRFLAFQMCNSTAIRFTLGFPPEKSHSFPLTTAIWNLSRLWESRGGCTEVINVCECTDGSKSTRSSKKALYFKIRIIPFGHFKGRVPAVEPVISPLVLISLWQINSTVHSVTVGRLYFSAVPTVEILLGVIKLLGLF